MGTNVAPIFANLDVAILEDLIVICKMKNIECLQLFKRFKEIIQRFTKTNKINKWSFGNTVDFMGVTIYNGDDF